MQVSGHLVSASGIAVSQEMHHDHCEECKCALEVILLGMARVTEDDQSHTEFQSRLQLLFLHFMCQSLILVLGHLILNLYIFKMVSLFCH